MSDSRVRPGSFLWRPQYEPPASGTFSTGMGERNSPMRHSAAGRLPWGHAGRTRASDPPPREHPHGSCRNSRLSPV
jgi:hypothetical protein